MRQPRLLLLLVGGSLLAWWAQLCAIRPAHSFLKVSSPKELENLFYYGTNPEERGDQLDLFDVLLEDIVPTFLDQEPNNKNGTASQFKEYSLRDTSNDDAFLLTGHQLITRSGFKYEIYDAVAEDGYVTQVTRLINPLADETKLREPPILIEHGGSIDPTAYILASSIQHFPERWPRVPEDGPIRSWNRSLAFYLANSGFRVFLADTRGSNDWNMRRADSKLLKSMLEGTADSRNLTLGEQFKALLQQVDFWAFSQDDIIQWEYRSHIDTVRRVTGSDKLHLMTFSLSTPTSLAFLGQRPDYADKIQGFVSMAPIVSGQGTSLFVTILFKTVCPFLPDELGTLVLTDLLFTQPIRDLLGVLSAHKYIRYTLIKSMTSLLMGASAKWRTFLELNLVGHLFRKLSFKELKQMCQQMRSNKLQKYDYGPFKNPLIYGSFEPPVYNISHLNIRDWLVVSGETDSLSTPEVVHHLKEIVNPKPAHVVIKGFNHLDLFAGWENDIYVNAPIARYFEQMSDRHDKHSRYTRSSGLDIASIFSSVITPVQNATATALGQSGANNQLSQVYLDLISKGMGQFLDAVTTNFGKIFMKKLAEKSAAVATDTVEAPKKSRESDGIKLESPGDKEVAPGLDSLSQIPIFGQLWAGRTNGMTDIKTMADTTKVLSGMVEVLGIGGVVRNGVIKASDAKVGATTEKQYQTRS